MCLFLFAFAGETLRSIWLKGDPNAVAELKIRVEEVINARMSVTNKASGSGLDNAYIIKLPVPNDKVGVIIGKGGMTIKNIQEKTRSTVLVI